MAGLASLLSRRTTNPRAGGAARRRELLRRKYQHQVPTVPMGLSPSGGPYDPSNQPVVPRPVGPPGGKTGGVVGYQGGGRTMNPRAAAAAARRRNAPIYQRRFQQMPPGPELSKPRPRGWQLGGEVGAAPEEVEMAAEIYARATPEQQDQITGGGGAPAMDEEAAIGEALAMAMGGGGGPPMNGAPPMGGMI